MYLGDSSLQYHIVNRQGCCIEHGHHHYQHIRPARGTVRGKVEQHANTVFIVGRHRQHFTWGQTGHSQSGTGRRAIQRVYIQLCISFLSFIIPLTPQAHHSSLPAVSCPYSVWRPPEGPARCSGRCLRLWLGCPGEEGGRGTASGTAGCPGRSPGSGPWHATEQESRELSPGEERVRRDSPAQARGLVLLQASQSCFLWSSSGWTNWK